MTKEEHAKVLQALQLASGHVSLSYKQCQEVDEAIAIMRKEPEPIGDARNFPHNTCPASRHAEMIGKALVKGRPYPMLTEEPEHCGESILSVVQSLYAARTKLALLEKANV